jgi:SAM-dependent methyltransferase
MTAIPIDGAGALPPEKAMKDWERAETAFWRDNDHERPESDSIENIINKITDCQVFLEAAKEFDPLFGSARTVLELGGGQGWACGALKKRFPHLNLLVSDITDYAVKSKNKWERIFGVSLAGALACKSYQIPLRSASIDIVFCYAAAHHFGDMKETLREISRVLTKGGHCLFLHEPTAPRIFHRLAYARVNRMRPAIHEDVLVPARVLSIARELGLGGRVSYHPTILKRGPRETLYYLVLSKVRGLQRFLPCTANFLFQKSA